MTITALSARKVTGAVIIGILFATVLGWTFGGTEFKGIVAMPPSLAPVFLQLDIAGALQLSMVTPILSMLIVDIFDTAGTLVGVATRANLLGDDGSCHGYDGRFSRIPAQPWSAHWRAHHQQRVILKVQRV